MTLSAAAVDDAVAWCLLVLVVALINNTGNYLMALWVFLTTVAFFLFLWFAVKPLFGRFFGLRAESQPISQFTVVAVFLLVCASAWFTAAIGVHSIFGGFLAGLVMPHNHGFAIKLTEKIEDLVTILFLPLFFAYSGLNTRIDQLSDGIAWAMVFMVIAVACFGKIIGCTAAGKLSGLSWRESLTVGILMNTKG